MTSARKMLQIKAQTKTEVNPEIFENATEQSPADSFAKNKPAEIKSGQKIYVIWDALGDGRVLGVFSDHELVKRIHQINPHYLRYYECELNMPLPMAVEWLDEKAQKQLKSICSTESK